MAPYRCNSPYFVRHSNPSELGSPITSNVDLLAVPPPVAPPPAVSPPTVFPPIIPFPDVPLPAPVVLDEAALTEARYTKANLQRLTKLYIELFFQIQGNHLEPVSYHKGPREGQLKAKFFDLYLGKSHMDCYHFC